MQSDKTSERVQAESQTGKSHPEIATPPLEKVAARLKSCRSEQGLQSWVAVSISDGSCFSFSISLVICHKVKESEGQQLLAVRKNNILFRFV